MATNSKTTMVGWRVFHRATGQYIGKLAKNILTTRGRLPEYGDSWTGETPMGESKTYLLKRQAVGYLLTKAGLQ